MEMQNETEVVRERDSDGADAEPQCLSFSEVYRRIQAGEQVPGLHKPDIKPCLEQPTLSQMHRKLKPWEK